MIRSSSLWNAARSADPRGLRAERVQLHHAAWLLGSVAHAVLPPRDDDSHTNLGIGTSSVTGGGITLATQPLGESRAPRLSVELESLELALCTATEVHGQFGLIGHPMRDALDWCGEALEQIDIDIGLLELRSYPDFPASDLAGGSPFQAGDPAARAALGGWFQVAERALDEVLRELPTTPSRVWPHHFDLGALVRLGDERGVGCGLSPGDEHFDEPYCYVYAWPTPQPPTTPEVSGSVGAWNTRGFTGPVLLASELLGTQDPESALVGFLRAAVALCVGLSR